MKQISMLCEGKRGCEGARLCVIPGGGFINRAFITCKKSVRRQGPWAPPGKDTHWPFIDCLHNSRNTNRDYAQLLLIFKTLEY